jgi:putative membrane protein
MIPGAVAVWKALPTAQRRMIAALLAAVALANVAQPYPDLAPLQHGPTLLLLITAPWLLRRWPLSTRAMAGIALFLALHTLGARYIYSYVPYDDWARAVTGHDLSSLFGARRNGYDRLVHFGFGALLTLPLAEGLRRYGGMSARMALVVAFAFIGLGSALYEIFEWLLTVIAAGETADYYNGQQGDVWDPQKDMAIAQLGSAIAVTIALVARRRAPYS